MTKNAFLHLGLVLSVLLVGKIKAQSVITIQSEIERPAGAPVFIQLKKALEWESGWVLENMDTKAVLPLQQYRTSLLVALLETPMVAGERRSYRLSPGKHGELLALAGKVEILNTGSYLKMMVGEKEALRYSLVVQPPPDSLPGYYRRSGFIHPVRSPSGVVVSDGFPVGHAHQHGIFMAWVNTLFRGKKTDFWNQHKETGTVAHLALGTIISGPVFAEAVVRLQHLSLEFGPVIEEEWRIRLYQNTSPFIWEIDSRQVNITEDTLHIMDYHYGGMGIRGSKYWNADDKSHFFDTAQVLTGAGDKRLPANHTHPGWVAIYGNTPSGPAGIAAMGHPENFRHPQAVRVHPEMPYFCFAPVVDGRFSLPPGIPYHSRYRFVVFDGGPEDKQTGLLYRDFGQPLTAWAEDVRR